MKLYKKSDLKTFNTLDISRNCDGDKSVHNIEEESSNDEDVLINEGFEDPISWQYTTNTYQNMVLMSTDSYLQSAYGGINIEKPRR